LDHVGDGGNGRRRASSLAAGRRQVLVRRAGANRLFCEQVDSNQTTSVVDSASSHLLAPEEGRERRRGEAATPTPTTTTPRARAENGGAAGAIHRAHGRRAGADGRGEAGCPGPDAHAAGPRRRRPPRAGARPRPPLRHHLARLPRAGRAQARKRTTTP
jgi:hypothetical protein